MKQGLRKGVVGVHSPVVPADAGGIVMNRKVLFAMGLTLLAPAAWAQTAAKLDPGSASQVIRNQEREHRAMQNATRYMEEAERRSWLKSAANLAKLRVKLAEAW